MLVSDSEIQQQSLLSSLGLSVHRGRAPAGGWQASKVSKGTLPSLYSLVGEMFMSQLFNCLYSVRLRPCSYRTCAFVVGALGSRLRHLRLPIPLRGACSPSFSRARPPHTPDRFASGAPCSDLSSASAHHMWCSRRLLFFTWFGLMFAGHPVCSWRWRDAAED